MQRVGAVKPKLRRQSTGLACPRQSPIILLLLLIALLLLQLHTSAALLACVN